MADQTMVLTEGIKAGILDTGGHANALAGTAAGADQFLMPNDGKVILVVEGGAAPALITFTAVDDKFGRTETLTVQPGANVMTVIGPFNPELWNDSNGNIEFDPAAGGQADDFYLAMRIANPT